jgi:hypothetical protein
LSTIKECIHYPGQFQPRIFRHMMLEQYQV